jgi:GNAT superfamily N-acetyltransferase
MRRGQVDASYSRFNGLSNERSDGAGRRPRLSFAVGIHTRAMSTTRIRLLGPGDEALLALLAEEEQDFDLPGRVTPRTPLAHADAVAYLGDPSVLHWVAEEDGRVVGDLLCYVERRWIGAPCQLLLYEIGVREADRRRGIGTALVETMRRWMEKESIEEVWVLADNRGAEDFYASCGFVRDDEQGVLMTLTVSGA